MRWFKQRSAGFVTPEFQVRFHRIMKWFWAFSIIPIEFIDNWKANVNVVILISVYANFISHWGTERALEAQLESKQQNKDNNKHGT